VIAFSGMATASISCLTFVESLVSPTTGLCTAFSWQRLKLYTRGGRTWAISVQGSRWKSFCRILGATEKEAFTDLTYSEIQGVLAYKGMKLAVWSGYIKA
jgi:hypothetical protein